MKEKTNLTVDERDAEKAQAIAEELAGIDELGNSAEELANPIDDELPTLEEATACVFHIENGHFKDYGYKVLKRHYNRVEICESSM